ncbi:GTPase family protein [Oerskovia sp. NPDC056781]|uniref:GTPase family protein n=1 Tax=Oerskovia sp. NPDC056781 TaxID=3345942 RepID=UPI00367246BF
MARLDLTARVAALETAVSAGTARLPDDLLDDARAVLARTATRTALSAEHTVVALAGSTGSGKSSLFNAIARAPLARPGITRPTTARPMAVVWGPGADPLLSWLEVGDRHHAADRAGVATDGLVLLDLPDHDSVVTEHRAIAERLVERVDLLVWVVDPQKYADAALHERYLRPLAGHGDVVVVVLNQIDRLTPEEATACLADLRRLVAEDGLVSARVLGVSATTGQGIDELDALLDQAAARREAAVARMVADLRGVACRIADACGDKVPERSQDAARSRLVDALEAAAGVPTVVDAVRGSANRRARAATGWPPTRWIGRLRVDPLRRLGLARGTDRPDLARTSVPRASPTVAARAHVAVREYVSTMTAGAPQDWALAARERVTDSTGGLADELDQAVAGTELEAARRPRWWGVVSFLQWVVLGALVVGLVWLGVLAVLAYLQLPAPETPVWRGFPWPTLLVVGGVVVGVVLALAARVAGALGARRRAARARRRLRESIAKVAGRLVWLPVAEELSALTTCRVAAQVAAT